MSLDQVINHLSGSRAMDAKSLAAPAMKPPVKRTDLLPGVDVHYCLMEMPVADVLAALPASLHPSFPGEVTATFYRVPESPVGPFEFAVVAVACRAGIRPRMLTTAAFASSEAACGFLRERCGFACALAEVRTSTGYHGADSSVTLNGELVLSLSTRDTEPVLGAGAAVKFCAPLNVVRWGSENALLQADFGYEYKQTHRGSLQMRAFVPERLGLACPAPEFVICGVQCLVDMEVHPWRMLFDPGKHPSSGTSVVQATAV